MELALSLGDPSNSFSFLDKTPNLSSKDLGFCMGLGNAARTRRDGGNKWVSSDPPLQLDLLPLSPVPRLHLSSPLRFPWLADNETGASEGARSGLEAKGLRMVAVAVADEGSSFQLDFGIRNGSSTRKREVERASDDEDNGSTRKKLRLSKQQSAFLEESFKQHNTLNPKQKLDLAKQLNLQPRQVEVWFQNRRARTKLKQTEVDCEYLKRCCETLTEENRRLQKELQELRALKASQPFYMQLPATTLTMCPSCERVATATAGKNGGLPLIKTSG
ncbi:hypothetical protein V6N13_009381 [Hibiscus sabdariffa]|uniref:Homeobox domain-containing protein n=1 Tax=Hibiscus sabdariffa TaxID=183260 RepID=A0ABR2PNV6_9ROSI